MSVFYVILLSLIVFFTFGRKKYKENQSETEYVSDFNEIEEDVFLSKEEALHDDIIIEKLNNEEVKTEIKLDDKKILSEEQSKNFSLKEAVIYSAILERPYK